MRATPAHGVAHSTEFDFSKRRRPSLGNSQPATRSANNVLLLVGDLDGLPRAVTMRVLDAEGREVYSEVPGNRFRGNGASALKWPRRSRSIIWRALSCPPAERANLPRAASFARGFFCGTARRKRVLKAVLVIPYSASGVQIST
jgi:hypothetical protein